ncbi:MAG: class I SAM-dependent methyltransferase [Phycisphaerae bacterium]
MSHAETLPPDAIKDQARKQFDKWALGYDRSLLNELVFYPSIRACQQEIARWQRARGGGRYCALDVGCGTATLLTQLARDPAAERLVGLDYSPVMIENAARKITALDAGDRLHAVVGDSQFLPFQDGTFDIVTCCNSFHHYPRQAEVVREFRRVLRPGGMLTLIDGFRDNVIGWVVFDIGVTLAERNVHHAPWAAVRQMMLSAGFADARQRKMNVLAPLLVTVASV